MARALAPIFVFRIFLSVTLLFAMRYGADRMGPQIRARWTHGRSTARFSFAVAIFLCCDCFVLGGSTPGNQSFVQVVGKFDALEAVSIDINRWKTLTNETGDLAWGTSYILEAYLDIYDATHDQDYLRKFMVLADSLTEQTDRGRNLSDYKGRQRVGWGSVRYSKADERIVLLVHTGMLVQPLSRHAVIVKESPDLAAYAAPAQRYAQISMAALGEFDSQWRYDRSDKTGYYVFEENEPYDNLTEPETPVPFNQQLAAGRAFINLWKLTGDPSYQQKAEGLATHFAQHLRLDPTGAYEWDYWYGKGLNRYRSREDISHGAIDVAFAVMAAGQSIVFRRSNLQRFTSAFYRYAGVTEGRMVKPNDAVGGWLDLSETDCGVYRVVAPYLMAKIGLQHPQVLLGIAKLARYSVKCSSSN